MISLTFLYDEYIDRPKLTEQKKPIRVFSSFPHKWGRNNKKDIFPLLLSFFISEATKLLLLSYSVSIITDISVSCTDLEESIVLQTPRTFDQIIG